MIRVKNLTKNYGGNKGVFDLSFDVRNGEIVGLLGPKGSGKSTVISLLMGFQTPASGRCTVHGKNCAKQTRSVMLFTGYLPGSHSLPEQMTGLSFLRFMAEMRGIRSLERALEVAERLRLDVGIRIGKMSEADRQKTALACAFMHDPSVLLLDEPSRGLDLLSKNGLFELLLEEKRRGKTILLTSDTYSDVERVCDRAVLLRRGMIVYMDDIAGIRASAGKLFRIGFEEEQEAVKFVRRESFVVRDMRKSVLTVALSESIQPLLRVLSNYRVLEFETVAQDLEEIFAHLYGGDIHG